MGTVNPLLGEADLTSSVAWALEPLTATERVSVSIAPPDVPVLADTGLLDRVIANLVENPLRHTPAGTPVEITARRSDDDDNRAQLKVIDHGRGTPSGSREALFAPFQRLGDVPNGGGLGLGLAVARGLTERPCTAGSPLTTSPAAASPWSSTSLSSTPLQDWRPPRWSRDGRARRR